MSKKKPVWAYLFSSAYFVTGLILLVLCQHNNESLAYFGCGLIVLFFSTLGLNWLLEKCLQKFNHIFPILLTIGVTIFAFLPLTTHSGWPDGHDDLNWKFRVANYYLHFNDKDFFPLWSSGDCFGLGSPLPLYYHKLFNYVATALLVITGKMKLSAMLSLMLFTMAGILGLFKCLRLLNVDYRTAVLIAPTLALMNYTVTDWLIRSAFSEFAAMMMVPWLIYWCLNLIKSKKFDFSIIWIFTLVFLAHNIIAYFGLFLIFIAIAITLISGYKKKLLQYIAYRGFLAGLAFLIINSVYLIPMLLISKNYDVSKIQYNYTVDKFFHNLTDYFYNTDYTWGLSTNSYSVEINLTFWILIGGTLIFLLFKHFRTNDNIMSGLPEIPSVLIFIVTGFLFYFILQDQHSLVFYQSFPGALFIQFPWRLLTFIQILGLLLLGSLITYAYNSKTRHTLALLYTLSIIVGYRFIYDQPGRDWKWYNDDEVESIVNQGVWGSGGEYIPNVDGIHQNDSEFFSQLAERGAELENPASGIIQSHTISNPETITRRFTVNLRMPATAILPINFSGLESISIEHGNRLTEISTYRLAEDPRIRVQLDSGVTELILHLPTLSTVFGKLHF